SAATRRYLLFAAAITVSYLTARALLLPVRSAHSAFLPAYGFMTVATYAERLVWPWPQTFFYRNLEMGPSGIDYPWGIVVAGVAATAGYFLLFVWAWRRDRAAAASLLAAVLVLAPVLNFFETGIYVSVSDHFLYLPLLLLLLGVGRAMRSQLVRLPERRFAFAALALGIVCFVPNTLRARDFKDNRTLWTRELAINPHNPVALDWLSAELATNGDPAGATKLIERALEPAASRYFLLAGKNADSGRHVRRVVLTAALTPDGDREALARLYEELESFVRGAPSRHVSAIGTLVIGVEHGQALTARAMNARGRSALVAELATIASRLGHQADTRRWLNGVDLLHPQQLPNPLAVILAQARTGDYPAAFASLLRLDEAKPRRTNLTHATLERLGKRLLDSQRFLDASRSAPGERAAMLRALSALELGAFGVACRELRPIYLANPEQQEVAQLYAQALASARLDAEAGRVVAHALGQAEAERILRSLKSNLVPQLRAAPPAPDTDTWWQAD
ncbi:MAG: hypothetical protein ABUL60_21045, partial [Myxococcales bacterium]